MDSGLAAEINRLSSRLRLLQKDLHDRAPEMRAQIYEDEIRRVLHDLPQFQAEEFINGLSAHFPSIADLGVRVEAPKGVPTEEMSTSQLVGALKNKVLMMGESEKEHLCQELLELGLDLTEDENMKTQIGLIVESTPRESQKPTSPTGQYPVIQKGSPMLDCIESINQQLWPVLRDISSYATHGSISSDKRCDIDAIKYLLDNNGSHQDIKEEMEKLKRLFGVLIHTVNNFSEAFYDEYMKPLEPGVISESAGGGGMFKSKEVQMWKHFCYLAQSTLARDAFKANVKTSMANTINNLKW